MSDTLAAFVRESNRIEGIRRVSSEDIMAHQWLLDLPTLTVASLEDFVRRIAGVGLRERVGMNVRVGRHRPPPGGPDVRRDLEGILRRVAGRGDPWLIHVAYETLHPFMDGNGRSGRALWAWQIVNQGHYPGTLALGFLHPAYYAALHHSTYRVSP